LSPAPWNGTRRLHLLRCALAIEEWTTGPPPERSHAYEDSGIPFHERLYLDRTNPGHSITQSVRSPCQLTNLTDRGESVSVRLSFVHYSLSWAPVCKEGATMQDFTDLTDDQAQCVVVEAYQLMPGASKPDYDELASWLGDLQEEASAEVAGVLQRLEERDPSARAAFARSAMAALAAQPNLQPMLEQAIERAGRAHMSALPELIAGVLLVMAILPSDFRKDPTGAISIQWRQLRDLAAVLTQVADVVKHLPVSLSGKPGN
jgi:hypothetical protein